MAWCWSGDKPLLEPMMVYLIDKHNVSLGRNELETITDCAENITDFFVMHKAALFKIMYYMPYISSAFPSIDR